MLIRFDDICPTMNWTVFSEVEKILASLDIKPMVAVIPDNRDKTFNICPPVPDFWDRVRTWQKKGWTIGLHGYQHAYVTSEPGIIGLNKYSEFAGLPESIQHEKIRKGLDIFEREGIRADVWIAPAHSFDAITLRVLQKHGLKVISDGFSRWPYKDKQGLFWIPQQLWEFYPHLPDQGVMTMCFHCNSWDVSKIKLFEHFIKHRVDAISSFQEVFRQFQLKNQTLVDRLDSLFFQKTRWSNNRYIRGLGRRIYFRKLRFHGDVK